ncbi:MAG: aminotransferase class V-fold PLP-dependent enzyme [Candidatus Sumerlaeia bacterium]|nr:aminotransferase class V-fold PLP-dependent enzyme [Candidatus Sumerlaeia bacterium]
MFSAAEFPILASGRIHMNHAGVAPVPARARDAMIAYAQEVSADFSLVGHRRWFGRVSAARAAAARLLGADSAEIAFTKNTTQGLQIVANCLAWQPGEVIVVEETTFPANWYVWKALERRHGVRVVTWPERALRYELDDLAHLLRAHPVRLVSLSAADYATGFRHDLAAAGALVRAAGALFCVDAIQVLGALPLDVRACGVDFLSADGHKWMLGPEGAGIFYARRERLDLLDDSQSGWTGRVDFMDFDRRDLPPDPTARRFEEGALNIAGILGLGGALDVLHEAGAETIESRLRAHRARLVEAVTALGWELVSPREGPHATGTASFRHPRLDAGEVARRLVDSGVTCTARRGLLRFSGHFYQPAEQMDRVAETLAGVGRALQ